MSTEESWTALFRQMDHDIELDYDARKEPDPSEAISPDMDGRRYYLSSYAAIAMKGLFEIAQENTPEEDRSDENPLKWKFLNGNLELGFLIFLNDLSGLFKRVYDVAATRDFYCGLLEFARMRLHATINTKDLPTVSTLDQKNRDRIMGVVKAAYDSSATAKDVLVYTSEDDGYHFIAKVKETEYKPMIQIPIAKT